MGSRLTRVLAVFGAVALLVVGVNAAAYAATGKSLILGKTNKASKVTTVQRTTAGPALNLKTKTSTSPPFTTNGKGKVTNLNADKVDGFDAPTLLAKSAAALTAANDTKAIRYKDSASSRAVDTTYNVGKVPAGTYLTTFNASITLTTAGTNASPQTVNCYLWESFGFLNGQVYAQNSSVSVGVGYASPSFSNVLTFDGTENLLLTCGTTAGTGWAVPAFISAGQAPTVSFVKLDGVTNKTIAP